MAPKAARKSSKPGQKRDPKILAALVDSLGSYIAKNPGLGIEAIGKGMNVPTRNLNLPIKKLLAAKKITKKGTKRATKYYGK